MNGRDENAAFLRGYDAAVERITARLDRARKQALALDERARVGPTLREFRELRGLKPDECASAVGISRSYLANIEAGRKPLTRVLLARLATTLNVRQAAIVPAGYFADDQQATA